MKRKNICAAILLAAALGPAPAQEASAVKFDYLAKLQASDYWFAYVHFDPFQEKYVLDAVSPTRDLEVDRQGFASSEILAIRRDGTRVQPYFSEGFDYRYARPLGEVVDDPAKRVMSEFPCNVSDMYAEEFRKRHPCGSRFTRPARTEYWPTLAGRMAQRPGDLSAFSIARPNPKEVARAVNDTGLRDRLGEVPAKTEIMPQPQPLVVQESLLLETSGGGYRADGARFLVSGVAVPAGANILLQGDANLFGRTKIPLADVRQVRIVTSTSQCAQVQVRLKSGDAKQFSRCNGSPFVAEVGGATVEIERVSAQATYVRDGRIVAGAKPSQMTLSLITSLVPSSVPRLTSFGVLSAEEAAQIGQP